MSLGLSISLAKPAPPSAPSGPVPLPAAGVTQEIDGLDIIGRKSARKFGNKVHFCVSCNFPIATYGRLIPCLHAFCATCANEAVQEQACLLCSSAMTEWEQVEALSGLFLCVYCLKSYTLQDELRQHVKEVHRAEEASAEPPPQPTGAPRPTVGVPPGYAPGPYPHSGFNLENQGALPPPRPPPPRPPAPAAPQGGESGDFQVVW